MSKLILSENGLKELMQSEGSRLEAYQDQAGVWTIGYGHTGKVNGVPIGKGMKITPEQQEQLLRQDVDRFENTVRNKVKVPLSQNQFDSLVNFAYNVGDGAFADSTLLRQLNLGNYDEAGNQILRWNKAGGKINQGLANRRERERALFFGGNVPIPTDYSPVEENYDYSTTQPQPIAQAFSPPAVSSEVSQMASAFKPMQPEEQSSEPSNNLNSFVDQITKINSTLSPLDSLQPETETPKQSNRQKYQAQLAEAFGVQPETNNGLPDYISELVRSVYDGIA